MYKSDEWCMTRPWATWSKTEVSATLSRWFDQMMPWGPFQGKLYLVSYMILRTSGKEFVIYIIHWYQSVANGSCSGAGLIGSRAADLGAKGVFLRQGNVRAAERPAGSWQLSQETLTRLRTTRSTPATPMLIESGLGNASDQERCQQSGQTEPGAAVCTGGHAGRVPLWRRGITLPEWRLKYT